MWLTSSTIALLVLLLARDTNCYIKINTSSKQFVDAKGCARIFHGVNVVYKSFPYYPTNGTFDPQLSLNQQDVDFLVEYGFNVVRLYVAWQGVEPTRGQYNSTYLKVLSDIVNMLGRAGIHTILDCHQDLWSPKFCGEGAPDYAALYSNRSIKPLPFPEPIPSLTPYKTDPATGYPYRSECNKNSFFMYYFTDAVGKTMQSLYDNEQKIQDHFAAFWGTVARHFSGNQYVLGYELLNEPWAGDIYHHPDQLEPKIAGAKNLMPMYKKLHSSIRTFDDSHIILFEPTIIITSVPFKGFAGTGITEGPGGPSYNDRQALAYHIYCFYLDSNGQPRNTRICDGSDRGVMEIRMDDAKKLGVAGFLTEWGAYDDTAVPGSRPVEDGFEIASLADEYLQSWTYWQFKGYGDFTTQSNTEEGLWFGNGTVQATKLKLLSRTYAQAVPGMYVNQTFDPDTGDFAVTFAANLTVAESGNPATIYLNEKLHYPSGYTVSIAPPGSGSYEAEKNRVLVTVKTDGLQDGLVMDW